tara:strand:+ start:6471 stop:6887 length:417 start_codon:yes stop_codon:yes gene_type:complete
MYFFPKNSPQTCNVLKHNGKILQETVNKWCGINGFSLTALAKKIGINQSTLYKHFDREDLPYYTIRRYGKAMGHDFRKEFPEMADDFEMVSEPERESYAVSNLAECEKQRQLWQRKYMELLERHNEMLMSQLQENKKV